VDNTEQIVAAIEEVSKDILGLTETIEETQKEANSRLDDIYAVLNDIAGSQDDIIKLLEKK
jgi:hypothetical protein